MRVAPFPRTESETYELGDKTYTVYSVARLFPLIEGAEFTRLVEDVRTHGVREPILVAGPDASVILDGRNRFRAAKAANVVPDFKVVPADADPVAVIVSANVFRRNMKKGQVAMIGALLRTGLPIGDPAVDDWLAAAEGVGDGAGVGKAGMWRELTQEQVAARLGISVPYLGRAERVLREARNLAVQVLYGAIELNAAVGKCDKPAPPVEDVRQTASASGEASGDRTDERPQSLRPSDKRHTTVAESAAGGENAEAAAAPSTHEEDASDPMPAPSGDASSQPAPTLTANETARCSGVPGPAPEPTTPPLLLACLRVALGDIDLDPCSSDAAKDRIGAGEWYSAEQNGLSLRWHGTVHVFPPLERVGEFADKLLAELVSGNVRRASFLGPADLRADWAVKLIEAPGFDGLVLERGRRGAIAASDRDQDVGRLALFLLGVGSSPAPKVFDGWGVPLSSMRGDRNEDGKTSAVRPATDDSERSTERPETSNPNSSAPASDGTVVGKAAGVDVRSTSRQAGDRVPQTEQRKAPNADSEVSRGGIADGSSARSAIDRDKPSLLKMACESRIGKRLWNVLAEGGRTTERARERSEPTRTADRADSGRTGTASKREK